MTLWDDLEMECGNAYIGDIHLHWFCALNAKRKLSMDCCLTLSIDCLQGKKTNVLYQCHFVIRVTYAHKTTFEV